MSTTVPVDERVVSMKFDNKQFEANVKTSMTTIERLKSSLNFNSAAKSFSALSKAASDVSFNPLEKSVDALHDHISMKTVAMATFISNVVSDLQHKLMSYLSVDQIFKDWTSGLNEYELKMDSIQTIMASTGESLSTVNGYLNELNKYSDDTIYSFSDMTNNIGKFTNAGVKLEDAVLAIKGVSNEAALSGANANEASRAMYNFAQALSAGFVKLIDWKSIENANMATVSFKDELLKTAAAFGTVKANADGTYQVLSRNMQGSLLDLDISPVKNFNDSLNYQWMTSEVLIETLKRYTDTTTELGQKATEAATQIKTFHMMMDTLSEAVQSGWAETVEYIVGDFEEAKELWTATGKVLGDLIGDAAEARNSLLATSLESSWDKLERQILEAGISADEFNNAIYDTYHLWTGNDISPVLEEYGSLEKAFQAGAISSGVMASALTKLRSKIPEFKNFSKDLNFGAVGEDVREVQQALQDLGYDFSKWGMDGRLGKETTAAIKAFQEASGLKATGIVDQETIDKLKEAGATTHEITDEMFALGRSISDIGGRQYLVEAWESILKDVSVASEAWRNAFTDVFGTVEERAAKITGIIKRISNFIKSIELTEEQGEKLRSTFRGVMSVAKIFTNAITLAGRVIETVAKKLLPNLDGSILNVTANIGDAITAFADFTSELIGPAVQAVSDFIDKIQNGEIEIPGVLKVIGGAFYAFGKAIGYVVDKLKSLGFADLKAEMKSLSDYGNKFLGRLSANFKALVANIRETEVGRFILNRFDSSFALIKKSVDSLDFSSLEGITTMFDGLEDFLKENGKTETTIDRIIGTIQYMSTKLSTVFLPTIKSVGKTVREVAVAIGWGFRGALDPLKSAWEVIKRVVHDVVALFASAWEYLNGLSWDQKIDLVNTIAKIILMLQIAKSLGIFDDITDTISGVGEAITDFIDSFRKATVKKINADIFRSMAVSIALLTACVIAIATLPDMGKVYSGLGVVVALILTISVMQSYFSKLNNVLDTGLAVGKPITIAAAILALATSMYMIIGVLKKMEGLDKKQVEDNIWKLAELITIIGSWGYVVSKGGNSKGAGMSMLGLASSLYIMIAVIEVYSSKDLKTKIDNSAENIFMVGSFLVGAISILGFVSRGGNTTGGALSLLALAGSLLVIAKVITVFDELNKLEDIGIILTEVIVMMSALGILAAVIADATKGNTLGSGLGSSSLVLAMAGSLLLIVTSLRFLTGVKLDPSAVITLLGALGIIVSGLVLVIRRISEMGDNVGKIKGAINAMSILTIAIAAIVWLLSTVEDPIKLLEASSSLFLIIVSLSFLLESLSKFTNQRKPSWKVIGETMTLLAALLGSLYLITLMGGDPEKVLSYALALDMIMLALCPVMESLKKLGRSVPKKELVEEAIAMMLTSTLAVMGLAAMSNNSDPKVVLGYAAIMGGIMLAVVEVMKAISKITTKPNDKAFFYSLSILGAALVALGGIVALSAFVPFDLSIVGYFGALILIMWSVEKIMEAISKISTKPKKEAFFTAMGILGASIVALGAVAFIGSQADITETALNLVLLEGIMWSIVGIMAVLGKIKKAPNKNAFNSSMNLLLAAVVALGVVAVIGNLGDNKKTAAAVTMLGEIMLFLVAAMAVMSKIDKAPPTSIILGAIGLLAAASVALGVLSNTIEDPKGLWKISLNIGIVMAAIVGALILLSKLVDDFPYLAVLEMCAVLGVLSYSLYQLAGRDSDNLINAMIAIVGVIAAMTIALLALSWATSPIPGAVIIVAGAFLAMGAGVALAGVGVYLLILALEKLSKIAPEAGEKVADAVLGMLEAFDNKYEEFAKVGNKIGDKITTSAVEGIANFWYEVFRGIKDLIRFGVPDLWKWMKEKDAYIKAKIKETITDPIVEGIKKIGEKFEELGKFIVEGLGNGIKKAAEAPYQWGVELGATLAKGFTTETDEHSPSKLFEKFGEFIDQGLINGISNLMGDVEGSGEGLGSSLISTFKDGVSGLTDMFKDEEGSLDVGNLFSMDSITGVFGKDGGLDLDNLLNLDDFSSKLDGSLDLGNLFGGGENGNSPLSGLFDSVGSMDFNPTVTPILDLSEIQNGPEDIQSMLNQSTYDLADANAVKVNDTLTNQFATHFDSSNTDVVNAIGKLKDEFTTFKEVMGNMGIYMDTGIMVGQLTPGINTNLGKMTAYYGRGN